ncbi:SNF2 family N-terminal domain-domain-containing protein, partial [Protomyces lactucae-debilis]
MEAPHTALLPTDKAALSTLYSSIPSPTLDLPKCTPRDQIVFDRVLHHAIPGLASDLYAYQVRTVCRMLRHELYPETILDPRLVPLNNVFFDQEACKFWKTSSSYVAPTGGILGEEMGTGKTCECLALMLASLDTLPANPALLPHTTYRLPPEHSRHRSSVGRSLQERCAQVAQEAHIPTRFFLQAYPHLEPVLCQYRHLIVVPDSLVSQWQHEIRKHVEHDFLQVLVLAANKLAAPTPDPKELLQYDLVLISHTRFSQEERQHAQVQHCRCSYAKATRQVICTCPKTPGYTSPLTQLHWLRLMVDEGHTMSSQHSKAVRFASQLSVERRWVVSGTPSRGLVGGLADGTEFQSERIDLENLSVTLCDFLKLQAFDKQQWRRAIAKPFLDRRPGATQCIRSLLEAIVIRNRQADMTMDVVLPPLRRKVVYLDPSPETALSLNIFNALIAINAVTSQRIDQDYFFHKSQSTALAALVRNLLISTFWWTGTPAKDVISARNVAHEALRTKTFSLSDTTLLQQSVAVLQQALESSAWQAMSTTHELGYTLNADLSESLQEYWLTPNMPRLRNAAKKRQAMKKKEKEDTRDMKKLSSPAKEAKNANVNPAILHASRLSQLKIVATSSAKLNYLLQQILQYAETDKIIVFS